MTRTIGVCAGIGDNIWLIQKLVNSGERFQFRLADDEPKRGKQIFDLIPSLSESAEYHRFGSLDAIQTNIQASKPRWTDVREESFFLSANRHLELGNRIELFFPDLKTSFEIDWATSDYRLEACSLMPPGSKYVGLYGSSYSSVRSWGFWGPAQWMVLADRIMQRWPWAIPVIVGASFDLDLAGDLSRILTDKNIKHLSLVGKPLGLVVEAMKLMSYFFAFPSGLGILSASVKCPTMMFYPPHLAPMIDTWADPKAIESRSYKGLPFCNMDEAISCAVNECGLGSRML